MQSDAVVDGAVFTVAEAAAYLRVGPKAIRKLALLRQIPHRKIDRRGTLRFSRAALERWLQEGGGR